MVCFGSISFAIINRNLSAKLESFCRRFNACIARSQPWRNCQELEFLKFVIFLYFCGPKSMRRLRSYSAVLMLVLFSCYYCGISMFQHTHISNGTSIVHSHLGGNSQHDHTKEQIAVIDIISTFQSECAPEPFCMDVPSFFVESSCTAYIETPYLDGACPVLSLRGPPQA